MALETDIGVIERPKPRLVADTQKARAAAPVKPRTGPPTDEKMSGVVCFAVWLASALVCWGIVALVIYALSTAPG